MDDGYRAVLDELINHEEAVAALYSAYAERFPEHREFWTQLAGEEFAHASWIRDLTSKIEQGQVHFEAGRFRPEAVRTSLRYLEELRSTEELNATSYKSALVLAVDIERALIEKRFFEVFKTGSPECLGLLDRMEAAIQHHLETLNAALQQA